MTGGGGEGAPVITTQPTSQAVAAGSTATFTVAATGTGTLAYKWLKNNTPITGAMSATYTTPATVNTDNGALFSVVVSSPSNALSTTSAAATLSVSAAGGTSGSGDVIAINAGSSAAVGGFAADTTCTASAEYDPGQPITIPAAIAAAAAPEKVYESACQGAQTYTMKGLVTGNTYTVVLHFAELYFPTVNSRLFNVAINGTAVPALQNFDIFAAAGNARFTAVVKTIPNVTAVNGQIAISLSQGSVDQPSINGIEIQSSVAIAPPPIAIAIDAGSPVAVSGFAADAVCTAGAEYDPGQTIAIPAAFTATAAPEKVYESACQGPQTYTLGGLVSGNSYTVLLHFAELYFTTAGSRQFNVAINGTPVAALQNFDIFAAANNARFTAVVETVPNITAVNGQIVIAFTNGAVNQPMFNGIQVLGTAAGGGSPSIATEPQNQTVAVGAAATFSVVAGGTAPFTYKWSKNGTAISGANGASYTTPPSVASDTGSLFSVAAVTLPADP